LSTCLASKGVQEFDGVDSKDWVNRSRCSLKVGVDILAKELDNVDEVVSGCDTELRVSLADEVDWSYLPAEWIPWKRSR
jgi:hypothetical protein